MSRTVNIHLAWTTLLLLGGAVVSPGSARAESLKSAVGFDVGWQQRDDFGADTRANFVPELVGYGYLDLGHRLHLRPGFRVGYSGLTQAHMPHGLEIVERDLQAAAEVGIVLDGPVVPSLAAGAGVAFRSLDVRTDPSIQVDTDRDRSETLPSLHVQAGLGIPFAKGFVVAEPFVRYEWMARDERLGWRFGLEVTFQVR